MRIYRLLFLLIIFISNITLYTTVVYPNTKKGKVRVAWGISEISEYYIVEFSKTSSFLRVIKSTKTKNPFANITIEKGKYYVRVIGIVKEDIRGYTSNGIVINVTGENTESIKIGNKKRSDRELALNDLEMANNFYNKNKFDEAQGLYELFLLRGAKLDDNINGIAFYRLGVIHLLKKEYDIAKGYFYKAVPLLKDDSIKVKALYNIGFCDKKLDNLEMAIESFNKVTKLDPTHVKTIIQKGQIEYKLKNYDGSIKTYKSGLAEHPDNFHLLFNLAKTYDTTEQYNMALTYYLKASRVKPSDSTTLYNIGIVLSKKKRLRSALSYLKRAYDIKPNDIDIIQQYGKTLSLLKSYNSSIKILKKGIKLYPDTTECYLILANVYYDKGNYKKVLTTLDYLVNTDNSTTETLQKMGDASFQLKRYNDSIKYYKLAIEKDEGSIEARKSLAKVFFKKKDLDNAINEFIWLVDNNPNDPISYYRLGECYIGVKEYNKAKAIFENLLNKFPKYKEKRQVKKYLKDISKLMGQS